MIRLCTCESQEAAFFSSLFFFGAARREAGGGESDTCRPGVEAQALSAISSLQCIESFTGNIVTLSWVKCLLLFFFCFTWTCCSNITFIFTHLQHLSVYYFNFNLHHCRSLGGHTYCQYPSAWLGSGVINACVQCGDTADTASSPLECCTRMLVPWGGSIDICNVQPLDYSICTLLWGMWEKYTNHIIENISVNGYLNHTWNQSILQFTATEIPRQNPFLFVCCVGSYGCLVLWVSGQ